MQHFQGIRDVQHLVVEGLVSAGTRRRPLKLGRFGSWFVKHERLPTSSDTNATAGLMSFGTRHTSGRFSDGWEYHRKVGTGLAEQFVFKGLGGKTWSTEAQVVHPLRTAAQRAASPDACSPRVLRHSAHGRASSNKGRGSALAAVASFNASCRPARACSSTNSAA